MDEIIESDKLLRCISDPSCFLHGSLYYTAFSLRKDEKFVSYMLKRLCSSFDFVEKRGSKIKYKTDVDKFAGVAQLIVNQILAISRNNIEIKMEDKSGGPHVGLYYKNNDGSYFKYKKSVPYPAWIINIEIKLSLLATVLTTEDDFNK